MQGACRSRKQKSIPHVKCARWQAKHALRAFFRRGREGSLAFAAFRAFSFLLPSPFILESICSECSVVSAESRSWSAGDWEPSLASTFISSCIPQPREEGRNSVSRVRGHRWVLQIWSKPRRPVLTTTFTVLISRSRSVGAPGPFPHASVYFRTGGSTYGIWRTASRRSSDPQRTVAITSRQQRSQLVIPPRSPRPAVDRGVADRGSRILLSRACD